MTITSDGLCEAKCAPCEGGVPPMPEEEIRHHLAATPEWELTEDGKGIARDFRCRNFVGCVERIDQIAELAEAEQHHPDLHLTGYRNLRVELTTHAIGGLSENDFIVAAKIDRLLG